jgi:hypothetical protein
VTQSTPLQEQVFQALFNEGVSLLEAGKPEAAIEAWWHIVQRFGDASELELALSEVVGRARLQVNVAEALDSLPMLI